MPLLRRKGGGIRSFLLQQWTFKTKTARVWEDLKF